MRIRWKCDTCDPMLTNDNAGCELSGRQKRFLDAYRTDPNVAAASRLAFVHRATVYRWQTNPAFVAAMRSASDAFFREHRAKVVSEQEARAEWRRERELERREMRCKNLERARAARR